MDRRNALKTLLALGSTPVWAQSIPFTVDPRYPDPAWVVHDPHFLNYRVFNTSLEQIATGFRWVEGIAYNHRSKYLVFSDIPNNRIMKWDELTGEVSVFRKNANFANGNVFDRDGRLITCEHSKTRRVVRQDRKGGMDVLADRYLGKRLNSPNDVIVKRDGTIWFTDPIFGIQTVYEGMKAQMEQKSTGIYRINRNGKLEAMYLTMENPNGLAFSHDEAYLYVVESSKNSTIWRFELEKDGSLGKKTKFAVAGYGGAFDGIKCDTDGNLWCSFGSNGDVTEGGGSRPKNLKGSPNELDGVRVYTPDGLLMGFIRLPEHCANLTFGGMRRNRLFMASSHSVYAIYTNTQGAV